MFKKLIGFQEKWPNSDKLKNSTKLYGTEVAQSHQEVKPSPKNEVCKYKKRMFIFHVLSIIQWWYNRSWINNNIQSTITPISIQDTEGELEFKQN